ncbi:MAG: hypothetical protein ACOC8H_01395 [bacterium]
MKRIVSMAVVLAASVTVLGGYSDDFREAKKLFAQGEYAEAADAFAQLAETAPKEYAKVWSLSYAARALGQGGQYEEAIEAAEAIQSRPMAAYTRMEIMSAAGKHAELAEAFKDEAGMAAWPDEINYKCFYLRGLARATSDDNQDAVDDFNQCVELAGSDTETKLDALGQQAGLLAGLGEEDKALAAYEKAFALFDRHPRWQGRWLYPRTILRAVALLMSQGKHDEAAAVLAKREVNPDKDKRGAWDFLTLEAYGDIGAARGRAEEALARYREAAAIDTHDSYVQRVEDKIEEMAKK